jgi:hypothetical protein
MVVGLYPVGQKNNAAPDSLSDHHPCLIDKNRGREWGMWNAVKQSGTSWQCGVGAASDLNADGSPAACSYWDSGVLTTYEFSEVFNAAMLRRFRLIKMPSFYDNNN